MRPRPRVSKSLKTSSAQVRLLERPERSEGVKKTIGRGIRPFLVILSTICLSVSAVPTYALQPPHSSSKQGARQDGDLRQDLYTVAKSDTVGTTSKSMLIMEVAALYVRGRVCFLHTTNCLRKSTPSIG